MNERVLALVLLEDVGCVHVQVTELKKLSPEIAHRISLVSRVLCINMTSMLTQYTPCTNVTTGQHCVRFILFAKRVTTCGFDVTLVAFPFVLTEVKTTCAAALRFRSNWIERLVSPEPIVLVRVHHCLFKSGGLLIQDALIQRC
jgi:hypothetical protein